ncbi:unnamed protein product [Hermetia illucens]|uniref:Chitin-binding type-2 domain-containing protein n=1 Tax=Hermetia illucens TaxID=343691 RepID=A0A7R8UKA0_HERIL|nr:uncharacterized protein LOC119649219 [Hermetia illucens]CAD7082223.1 unnamed protein product [Hermetia illucens]
MGLFCFPHSVALCFLVLFADKILMVLSDSAYCGVLGNLSGVVCITETKFILQQNSYDVFDCPEGHWCANHPEICVSNGEPACKLIRACRECFQNSTSACYSEKTYALCNNGQLDTRIMYCPASKPYCSMRYDDDGIISAVCTNRIQQIACDGSATTTPKPDQCPSFGKFPNTADTTCRRYFYCYSDRDQGGNYIISRVEFMCPSTTVYDPSKGKCVPDAIYKCENVEEII